MMFIVKDATKKMKAGDHTIADKIIFIFKNFVLFFGLFIYSIFLPLRLETAWFYAGLVMCMLGVITWTIAMVNIANIPLGQAWTKGLYRYSRHPMVLSSFLIFIGAGVASASWVFLLFSIVLIILSNISVSAEERFCLEQFGNPYREYMARTPKWLGIPKTEKKVMSG